ncbi:hypothetical protein KP509_01G096400 [Ceratopteris richardii]|uniref:nucleoside-diphosphate kinase n=1 Tax=Ceratopteris richardii TaxID=49495 RepID=A0A8T2VS07_CERRI|nr:hypothetical protein KP509_01G096400 [Ceratopteris richardii]
MADGVQWGLVSKIISRFEEKGFILKALKLLQIHRSFALQHYADLVGKPFFDGLIDYVTSDLVIAMVWYGRGAILTGCKMLRVTKPTNSNPGTIRGDYGVRGGGLGGD